MNQNNETQVSEVQRAETCWSNYPRSAAIVTLAESKRSAARSVRGTIPPMLLAGTWDLRLAENKRSEIAEVYCLKYVWDCKKRIRNDKTCSLALIFIEHFVT